MRKIFVADIFDAFGRAASGAGYGIKYAWDTTTGNKRLEKRRLGQHDGVGIGTLLGTTVGALASGLVALLSVDITGDRELGKQIFFCLWGTLAAAPITIGQLSSIYQCSAHDRKQYLLERNRKAAAAALPPPSPPPRKLT